MSKLYIALLTLFCVSSCIPNKKVVYFQANENALNYDSLITLDYPNYHVQANDNLDISITSMLDVPINSIEGPEQELFSRESDYRYQINQLARSASDLFYLDGYPVDQNGNIELPLLGHLNVEGKTLEEVKELLTTEVKAYIKEPYVTVRLGGIRYTALGEFRRPGRYSILQNYVTIYEAIANAGDLTITANRMEVLLIRQYPSGQKMHQLDLTDESIVNSEYYFIHPNDQIYVKPLKVRELGTEPSSIQTVTSLLSIITAVALVLSLANVF